MGNQQLMVLPKYINSGKVPQICIRKLSSGEGYEFCGCARDENGRLYWERLVVADSRKDGGVEYGAAGRLMNALPAIDMNDPKSAGTLLVYVAGIVSNGYELINAKKTGEEFLWDFEHRASYFGRDSEGLIRSIEKEPEENREIMNLILGRFTTVFFEKIVATSERFPYELRAIVKELLGYDGNDKYYAEIKPLNEPPCY